jgi:hypothetical protein
MSISQSNDFDLADKDTSLAFPSRRDGHSVFGPGMLPGRVSSTSGDPPREPRRAAQESSQAARIPRADES